MTKLYTINLVTESGALIPLNYAASDYATQSDIVEDKEAFNEYHGFSNTYKITEV